MPRAQYGDEAAVPLASNNVPATLRIFDSADNSVGAFFNSSSNYADDNLQKQNVATVSTPDGSVSPIRAESTGSILLGFRGKLTSAGFSLKASALRSATALQKYKEIQNSNDPDFASQVLAHFGIKPKTDDRTSVFIGGDDKTISINPQVNTNLQPADKSPTPIAFISG